MLTAEMAVAVKPSVSERVEGTRPPPIVYIPPTAVMPETALVTAISGEWSECATPHTTW